VFLSCTEPGDIKVQDTNGDYKITDADRVILGTQRPSFTANIANYLNYKDFDLNFSFNASYGNMLNYDRGLSFNGRYNCTKVNYWKVTEYDATGNATASNGSNEAPRPNNGIENPGYRSSLNYFKASFLRLSDATLGYTLPKNLISRVGITKFRMYVTVQNAFCITKFPGTDPESGENFNVPTPRTFMIGINMSL
jgi:TonB dependent receptor